MVKRGLMALVCVVLTAGMSGRYAIPDAAPSGTLAAAVKLPPPITDGKVSVEKALSTRRSVRSFTSETLKDPEIAQLLWSAQGVTDQARGYRTAPSAGALYPLEIYAVVREGVYKYDPGRHEAYLVKEGDVRQALSQAALGQLFVGHAPLSIVITAVYDRTARKYGQRAEQYVHIEVGCAAENVMLQAVALGLASVPVGAFRDGQVASVIGCPREEKPLLVIPIGRTGASPPEDADAE